jgi:hypothetical protein
MENIAEEYTHIKGWGVEANPHNEPTAPMKKYTGDDHKRLNYEKPQQQEADVEILHSNERPDLSAVFGTSVTPSGLSGDIRRYAFRYSESSLGHWFTLFLADRVNVIEGIIDDLGKGYIPNIFAERGWKAEWKYNKKELVKKAAVAVAITTLIFILTRKRRTRTREEL